MSRQYDKLSVLVADDNRTNLYILKVFLNKLGHEAILAENGEEAVRLFKEEHPDLILMDIMMPVMDGFEAARQIKALSAEKWVPLIFVSAMNRDDNLVQGLESGCDDYLTKPVNFVVLEAKLSSIRRSLELQNQAINTLKRLQSISDVVQDVIVTVDAFGMVQNCSRAIETVYGWSPRDVVGHCAGQLLNRPSGSGWLNELLANPLGQEFATQRRDGTDIVVEVRVSNLVLDGQQMHVCVLRDITQRKADERRLRDYFDQNEQELSLAKTLLEMQLHRPALQDPHLHYWVSPNTSFSGDMIAGARAPDGCLYALLADATGHGLGAAISALPVLSIFYRMAKAARALPEIVGEMNQQLKESIPVGRFVALAVVWLNPETRQGEIWVGGTPPVILLDGNGQAIHQFPSHHLPLGIQDSAEANCTPVPFAWADGAQLLFCSDGLVEAENHSGHPFGDERLIQASQGPRDTRLKRVQKALEDHLQGRSGQDDISVLLVDCP